KWTSALRFGILGAAHIGPDALITPARSHPDVIISAVATRDHFKATQYAKKHTYPRFILDRAVIKVRDANFHGQVVCYEQSLCVELVDDPEIDVIYNPLPNALHYEWTMRALRAGKHVLVEKPMATTSEEAREMIATAQQKGLVLLEAIHYTFHPATQRVKEIIISGELGNVKDIKAEFAVPSLPYGILFHKDDIRFNYDLGGGCTMDMGVYPLSALHYFASSEPIEVVSATATGHATDPTHIDRSMHTIFKFLASISGETFVDFQLPGWGLFSIIPQGLKFCVYIKLEGGEIDFTNFALPHLWHSIKVRPRDGKARIEKMYKRPDGSGEEWWSSYRYQLEAFVEKIRSRTPQYWPASDEAMR
ncbi:hypothetical protein BU17DRAFT_40280, partial [Hysterangium stoloniferum]